jgi:hypothetical protein
VKSATILAMFLGLASGCIAVGQQAATKPESGMYVDQDGTLIKLTVAPHPTLQIKSRFVKASGAWIFRGAEAPVQLPMAHPRFVLYGSSDHFVIVELDKKSDHREAQAATSNLLGAHGGFDEKKTIDMTATKQSDGGLNVSPEKDLKTGEYLITTEVTPRQAYDFGIQAEPH